MARGASIPFFLVHVIPLRPDLHGHQPNRRGAVHRDVHAADLLHHRGLPPLLLAPRLQDGPGPAVHLRVRWHDSRRRRARCGGPIHHRHHHATPTPTRPAQPAQGVLVEPCRVDPVLRPQGAELAAGRGLRPLSRAALPEPPRLDRRGGRSVSCASSSVGWSGLLFGFFVSTILLWHGTFSINSVTHLVGRPALRHRRHQPQPVAHRTAHVRRGMAQQPPPLPELRPPGLPLVGARHLLRDAAGAELVPRRARPAPTQPGPARGPAHTHRQPRRRHGAAAPGPSRERGRHGSSRPATPPR